MNELVVTVGAPGSGKSTWAARQPARVISTDPTRAIQDGDRGAIGSYFEWAFNEVAQSLARGETVIFDSCSASYTIRRRALDVARALNVNVRAVVFHTDLAACCAAQCEREDPVPLDKVRAIHAAVLGVPDVWLLNEGFASVEHVRREAVPC